MTAIRGLFEARYGTIPEGDYWDDLFSRVETQAGELKSLVGRISAELERLER